jgi:hypothetical protein
VPEQRASRGLHEAGEMDDMVRALRLSKGHKLFLKSHSAAFAGVIEWASAESRQRGLYYG